MGKTIIFRGEQILDMRRAIVTVEYSGIDGVTPPTFKDYEVIGLDGLIAFINDDLERRKHGFAKVIAVREETAEEAKAARAAYDAAHMADE